MADDFAQEINPELREGAVPLTLSETLQILERSKLDFSNDKRLPSDAFLRMHDHASRFAQFKSEAGARESRAVVKALDVPDLHQVVLCDLMPSTAAEAKVLLRTIGDKVSDDELQRVLDALHSKARSQDAAAQ